MEERRDKMAEAFNYIISYELKRKCAEMANAGATYRKIYDDVFMPSHPTMSYETFPAQNKTVENKAVRRRSDA